MSRLLVALPEEFIFSTLYRVTYSDINAANHLGADRILPIAMEAQFGLIKHLGYEDAVVFEDIGLIMVNSQIDYLSEGHYGDEIRVDVALEYVSEKAVDLIYHLWNSNKQQATARVKARMLFFDYQNQRPTLIPQGFKNKVTELPKLSLHH